jgi:hypothetical protein
MQLPPLKQRAGQRVAGASRTARMVRASRTVSEEQSLSSNVNGHRAESPAIARTAGILPASP